jgi:class 3 adenylate cyclase/tetratricopeptide (TPR) repeat protein
MPGDAGAPRRRERKVVSVLFCDLVGFTAQAETMDPEDVEAVLRPYHDHVRGELERHGGTVEKFIGDAVMALFGAPIAHEDDAERAVRAALAIRDWAVEQRIELRIGITTGEALVRLDASPSSGEGMASGDVVNTAARLQAAAPTNGVLVDEPTLRSTERVIEFGNPRSLEAKGKATPIPVWDAVRARARVGVERVGGADLVGRTRELVLLRETLARVIRERQSQLITLVGVPGIGKSRLVYELFKTVEEGTYGLVFWRHGRSLPYGEGVTFWALGEIVKAQAGILESDSAETAVGKLREAITGHVEDSADAAWMERHLRPLAGLETEGTWTESRGEDAFVAWRRYLESIADFRPLVLVFEDLQWADDLLLDFIDHLVDRVTGVPLLVLATTRPELLTRHETWGGGKVNSSTILLSPLSDDETAELVRELLGHAAIDAELEATLRDHAGGNPMYAEEFSRLHVERPGDAAMPESVQGMIAARLDTLPADEKRLLQDASVIGRVFWLGALGDNRQVLEERLHSIGRKEFITRVRRSSVAGEDEYVFRHALIRDVAYEQIPRAQRADKHVQAARWIESLGRTGDHAEMLAHHYLDALNLRRASGTVDEELVGRVRAATQDAGDRALALHGSSAAIQYYRSALELLAADDPNRPDLLLRVGRAYVAAAQPDGEGVLNVAAEAFEAANRPEGAAEAHLLLAVLWWDRGLRDRSYAHLDRARAIVGEDTSEIRAAVLMRLARFKSLADEHEEAIRVGGEALRLAEQLDLADLRVHTLATIGSSRFQSGDVDGIVDMERSLEIAIAAGSDATANAYNNLSFLYFLLGDIRRDRELLEEAARVAERFGDGRILRFSRLKMPMRAYYAGEWDRALGECNRAIAEFEAGDPHYLEAETRNLRAILRAAMEDIESAVVDAAMAVRAAQEAKDPQLLLPAGAVQLRLLIEAGLTDEAQLVAADILNQLPRHAAVVPAVELAWAARSLGNEDAVRDWIMRVPYQSRWSAAALAVLAGDLERAARLFAEIGSLPDEARSLSRTASSANLRRALEFWRSAGATRYASETEARLAQRVSVGDRALDTHV